MTTATRRRTAPVIDAETEDRLRSAQIEAERTDSQVTILQERGWGFVGCRGVNAMLGRQTARYTTYADAVAAILRGDTVPFPTTASTPTHEEKAPRCHHDPHM